MGGQQPFPPAVQSCAHQAAAAASQAVKSTEASQPQQGGTCCQESRCASEAPAPCWGKSLACCVSVCHLCCPASCQFPHRWLGGEQKWFFKPLLTLARLTGDQACALERTFVTNGDDFPSQHLHTHTHALPLSIQTQYNSKHQTSKYFNKTSRGSLPFQWTSPGGFPFELKGLLEH